MAKIITYDSNTVIDIAAMQKIANAVNTHDDILTQYINSAIYSISPQVNTKEYRYIFDPSKIMIQYGRIWIDVLTAEPGFAVAEPVKYLTDFASGTLPFVVASPSWTDVGPSAGSMTYDNTPSWTVGVSNVDSTKFTITAHNAKGKYGTSSIYVNWIAVGEKPAS